MPILERAPTQLDVDETIRKAEQCVGAPAGKFRTRQGDWDGWLILCEIERRDADKMTRPFFVIEPVTLRDAEERAASWAIRDYAAFRVVVLGAVEFQDGEPNDGIDPGQRRIMQQAEQHDAAE